MSFWRKYVKTFTRQWLQIIGTLKDQHKLYKCLFLSSCSGSSVFHIFIGRKWKDGCHPEHISIYYVIHILNGKLGKIHMSPACTLCWTGNLRKEHVFFWLNHGWSALLSGRPVWFYCPVFWVPTGVVSKASHVSESISVSTSPISLWPQPAHCASWRTQCFCFYSFLEGRTMRSSR